VDAFDALAQVIPAIVTNSPHRNAVDGPKENRARVYWNDRARRFASQGAGLGAVCSYGMPWFYNASIDFLQGLALAQWLHVQRGTRVLEIGCGVGRWSRRLAKKGATVTGIDLSHTMIVEARRRTRAEGLEENCRFVVADVGAPAVRGQFDLVFGVTVLQHVLDREQFDAAVRTIQTHLAPDGVAILLEAAPSRCTTRCDTPVFVARNTRTYVDAFRMSGLRLVAIGGVDPAPFKTWFLPWYRVLPRPLGLMGLAVVTAVGFAIDGVLGRLCPAASWHKVFVLAHRP
jgi:2-polyprenyl-3-methyl-5-hydroxy-6-metoxy-1,4-benzoquinol methylase